MSQRASRRRRRITIVRPDTRPANPQTRENPQNPWNPDNQENL